MNPRQLRLAALIFFAAAQTLPALAPSDLRGSARGSIAYQPTPVTPALARTWRTLQQPLTLSVPRSGVTVDDFFADLKKKTARPDGPGLNFVIDLNPNTRTKSPERFYGDPDLLEFDDVPLASALRLLLDPYDWNFYVQKDGVVVITDKDSAGPITNPLRNVLDELRDLRAEVARLRREVRE